MKYNIGHTIGDFTVSSYTPIHNGRRHYVITCSCGTSVKGNNQSIGKMEQTLEKHGYAGCMTCIRKRKALQKVADGGEYRDVYVRYKKGAKHRDIAWNLDYSTAKVLFSSSCHYCGSLPLTSYSISKYYMVPYNGIDRVDSSKNYTIDNVVSCCRKCNVAKSDLTTGEFLSHIKQIYDFQRLERKLVDPSGSKQEGPI